MILEIAGLLLFLLVAFGLLYPMLKGIRRQRAQSAWPRVRGVVTEHRVVVRGDSGFPEYRVRYTFGGQEYESFCGSPAPVGHTAYERNYRVQQAVQGAMAKRPVGETTEIMVDPADPERAHIVERELPARAIAIVVSGVFLVFLVVFVIIAFDLL